MVATKKGSVIGRFSMTVVMVLAIPAFAAAQRHGGGFASAPMSAGRSAPTISRGFSASPHANVRVQSGTQSAARSGAQVVRTRNGTRIIRRNNFGFNNGFNNGTNFSDVPGLGFDFPHLAAISGNRRFGRGGRFGGFDGGFPFGFSGFLLNPPIIDEGAVDDSQVAEDDFADDPPPQQYAPRRPRAPRLPSEPQAESAPTPVPDAEQYVFVRRDGSLVFAVAYTWENGTLRYVTPDGLRHTIGRDALDLNATQQFNEQRGINFRIPA